MGQQGFSAQAISMNDSSDHDHSDHEMHCDRTIRLLSDHVHLRTSTYQSYASRQIFVVEDYLHTLQLGPITGLRA